MKIKCKLLLNITFLLMFSLNAQEVKFDELFLQSLPQNIKDDFISQSQENDDKTKNLVNPDTKIQKLESALQEARYTLQKIQYDLDIQKPKNSNELRRFGDYFFKSFQSTFMPTNEPNLDGNYILDYGDILNIQFVGQRNDILKSKIERSGVINIPEIGEVSVAGLSLLEASKIIKELSVQAFVGVESYISLSEIRDINVMVVGNVVMPGMYTLSGGSTPLSLLDAAGGISENGSFRYISHKRNNILLQNIDLYEFFIKGNTTFNHQLRSGDVLVVHPKRAEVRVSGNFANPAIYEITESDTLADVLNAAGPFLYESDSILQIERHANGKINKLDVSLNDSNQFILFNGDSIKLLGSLPALKKTKTVTISGEVGVPGVYSISDTTTISELIKQAGSFTENAYPMGGILLRESIRKLETESKEKSYNELVRYIVASPNFAIILSAPDTKGILTFLSILKDYKPTGRLITDFNTNKINASNDRILEDGDRIHIPAYTPDVFIFGEVMNPGAASYIELDRPIDYIKRAGNLSRVADSDRVLLITPNGSVKTVSLNSVKLFGKDELVLPGSTIYVPRQVGKLDGINLANSVAPIVSSLALSIASLNSINN